MIDPRIPLGVEGPPDPLVRMGQIMGLRQQRQAGQRQEAQFAAEQREQAEQEAVRAVIQKHGGFTDAAVEEIATINPEAALRLKQFIQQGQITALNLEEARRPKPPPLPIQWDPEKPLVDPVTGATVRPAEPTQKPVVPIQWDPTKPLVDPATGAIVRPAEPPTSLATTFDAEILAAKRSGDSKRLAEAIALKAQAEAAGRAPARPQEPNQGQFTAAGYAGRLEQADKILTDLTDPIAGMGLASFEFQKWIDRPTFQSPTIQSYMQAARNFINAVLRRESGAVISPSEFAEARAQYLPQPGDVAATLQQKAANRTFVKSTMRRSAGTAYEAPVEPPSDEELNRPPQVGDVVLFQGKRYRVKAIRNGRAQLEPVP